MAVLRGANDLLRFLLELCAVAAAGYWGFAAADGALAWLLGIAAPVLIIMLWGALVAPRAEHRLPDPLRLILELWIFAAASVGLAVAGQPVLGAALAIAVVTNIGLMFALGTRGH